MSRRRRSDRAVRSHPIPLAEPALVRYRYIAYDNAGRRLSGAVNAQFLDQAKQMLWDQEMHIVDLRATLRMPTQRLMAIAALALDIWRKWVAWVRQIGSHSGRQPGRRVSWAKKRAAQRLADCLLGAAGWLLPPEHRRTWIADQAGNLGLAESWVEWVRHLGCQLFEMPETALVFWSERRRESIR